MFFIATYSFPAPGDHQLPLEIGDFIQAVEETDNWYRGRVADYDESSLGIFPKDFVTECTKERFDTRFTKPLTTLDRTIMMYLNSIRIIILLY